MVESPYADLNPKDTTICELQQKPSGTETHFWYADQGKSEETGTGCTGTAITTKLTTTLGGQKIASGKLLKADDTSTPKEGTITSTTKGEEYSQEVGLADRKINTKDGHDTKYYYLVVKYPNQNENQSTKDVNKTISVTLSLDESNPPTVEVYNEMSVLKIIMSKGPN